MYTIKILKLVCATKYLIQSQLPTYIHKHTCLYEIFGQMTKIKPQTQNKYITM